MNTFIQVQKQFNVKTKAFKFLELTKDFVTDSNNILSKPIYVKDIVKKDSQLQFGNGGDFIRKESKLCKTFKIVVFSNKSKACFKWDATDEEKKLISIPPNNEEKMGIYAIQIVGYNKDFSEFKQYIPVEVRNKLINLKCVNCGTSSSIEIDHKDGRKLVYEKDVSFFQPLCKHCNTLKREKCKTCKINNKPVYPPNIEILHKHYIGDKKNYTGCKNCYWYDCKKFMTKFLNLKNA